MRDFNWFRCVTAPFHVSTLVEIWVSGHRPRGFTTALTLRRPEGKHSNSSWIDGRRHCERLIVVQEVELVEQLMIDILENKHVGAEIDPCVFAMVFDV